MKLKLIPFITLLITSLSISQETEKIAPSIAIQFDEIYKKSTSYKIYKVISKEKFLHLKQNTLDSLKESKEVLFNTKQLLTAEKHNVKNIQKTLSKTKLDLETTLKKQDTISFFGLQLSKGGYSFILWAIILLLLLSTIYFFYKYSENNFTTKTALNNLSDVEEEFEIHRKKSLEREQKLRRKLQDEINKQKNN